MKMYAQLLTAITSSLIEHERPLVTKHRARTPSWMGGWNQTATPKRKRRRASNRGWHSWMEGSSIVPWETAAPFMETTLTKTTWNETIRTMHDHIGPLASRSLFSTTETAEIPSAPHGRYVIVQFRSRFAREQTAVEEVVAVLSGDGRWRVDGYHVFTGEPFTAKLVVTSRAGR